MTWRVEWDDRARKELRKLDSPIQKEILNYLRVRSVASVENKLKSEKSDWGSVRQAAFWRKVAYLKVRTPSLTDAR